MFRDLSPTTFSGETVNKSQPIATITLAAAKKMAQAIVIGILNAFDSGIKKYSTRKINTFNVKGEKVGSITKGTTCNADMYRFINGYLMAHRKKNDNWVKAKYIR